MTEPIGVAVLGSTGSVGRQALDVVRSEPERFRVVALACGRDEDQLRAQAAEFGVAPDRARLAAGEPQVLRDLAALPEADVVLNAVVGFAGLPATLSALEAGRRLALANKESLIAAGPVVREAREAGGGEIVPVDSEHSALYQALQAGPRERVRRVILTASGGPFRGRAAAELESVGPEDALAHPTWNMGPKITIDSSTLMNKGLEVIEARELFGLDVEQVEVVVHPQSVVHGMVEFTDGATVAQLSMPDMRLPIAYALAAPDRVSTPVGVVDWAAVGQLTFEAPDLGTFRCLGRAYEAARSGGAAPAVLSAANEVAVEAFLAREIGWPAIAEVVEQTLDVVGAPGAGTLDDVLFADQRAREAAREIVKTASA
ncbi:MAG: 1-deoxy-D-xylulose-5-phosphate reductoisomerase [Actinobacteria bacterium]|nr:1-deoxy-D-xylulose-5-phosphate reductoisomerase [Actinomycetota bacterium]